MFDRYVNGPSTKCISHLKRTIGRVGVKVKLSLNMMLSSKIEKLFTDKINQQRFTNLLGNSLQGAGCSVIHAETDADLLITQTAVATAKMVNTIVVGNVTDSLVLLLYHADNNSPGICLHHSKRQMQIKRCGI